MAEDKAVVQARLFDTLLLLISGVPVEYLVQCASGLDALLAVNMKLAVCRGKVSHCKLADGTVLKDEGKPVLSLGQHICVNSR